MRDIDAGPYVVLHDAAAVAAAVGRIAHALHRDLAGARVVAVPVMNAALFFAADLLRALDGRVAIEGYGAAAVSSYGDQNAPRGEPSITAFPPASLLQGRTALVLDTVVDTGATAGAVVREAKARGAADVRVACLADKPARRREKVAVDWRGFVVEDVFLVGYGLDAAGRFRTLPCLAAMREPVPAHGARGARGAP